MQENNNGVEENTKSYLQNVEKKITNRSPSLEFFSSELKKVDSKPKTIEIETNDPIGFLNLGNHILSLVWAYVCGGDFALYQDFVPTNSLLRDIYLVCEADAQKLLLSKQIQNGNLSLLYGNDKIINALSFNFKEIATFKVDKSPLLLYIMNCAQSDLLNKYLSNADQKKQSIKDKFAAKLLELKDRGYARPVELKAQFIPYDNKLTKGEMGNCKILLSKFKEIAQRDLSSYLETLPLAQKTFVELYLNILLMNEDEWQAYMESSGGFGALMLTPLDDLRVVLGKGDRGFEVDTVNTREKTNGLMLLVELGNLRILELCSERIKSFIKTAIDLNTENIIDEGRSIHLGELLAKNPHNEAVLQFLFEQGAAALHRNYKKYDYFSLAYLCAGQSCNQSLLLAIAWEINVDSPCKNRRPLLIASEADLYEVSIIILLTANIDVNALNSNQTVLERTVRNAYSYVNARTKAAYQRTWQKFLNLISLLLAVGSDASKFTDRENNSKLTEIVSFSNFEAGKEKEVPSRVALPHS